MAQFGRFVGLLADAYSQILAVVQDPPRLAAEVAASQATEAGHLAETIRDDYQPSNREEEQQQSFLADSGIADVSRTADA